MEENGNNYEMFEIPIRIDELMMALINSGRAQGLFLQDSIILLPLTTYEYTFDIPQSTNENKIAVFFSFQALPDPDNQIAMTFMSDGEYKFVDTSMVAGMYEKGLNFLRDFALIWYARRNFGVKFTNLSATEAAKLSFRATWAYMPEKDFTRINDKYFEVIKNWLLEL